MKKFLQDLRTWYVCGGVLLIITLKILGFVDIPNRLAVAEETITINGDAVKELADNLGDYIREDKIKEEAREIRHTEQMQAQQSYNSLMMEYIKETRRSNGDLP